jgi:hypothetical protein
MINIEIGFRLRSMGMSETPATRPQGTVGTRYWTELEDAAFVLWFKHGRSMTRVHKLLTEDPDDPIPSIRTLTNWAKKNRWQDEAQERMRALAPQAIQLAALEIAYGAHDASMEVMRIARNINVTREDKTVLEAAKFVIESTVGDSIATLVKPTIQRTINTDNVATMQDAIEAERQYRELADTQ